jgi:DNA-binding NarL/FixJ family response regulator
MAGAERIVVAARSGLLRAAHGLVLRDAGFEVLGEAGDGPGLLRKVRAYRPDVAIVDSRGFDDGLEASLRALRAEVPGVAVLVLADRIDIALAAALLDDGAAGAGYLLEARIGDVTRLEGAIGQVAAGGSVLEPELVASMLGRGGGDEAIDSLSGRDREVLAQIAAGATNRAIARRMFLSERAIERHVTRIFQALGLAPSRLAHRRVLAVLAYLAA